MVDLFGRDNPLVALTSAGRRRTPVLLASFLSLLFVGLGTGGAVMLTYGLLFPTDVDPVQTPFLDTLAFVCFMGLGFGSILLLLWLWTRLFEVRPFATLGLLPGNILRKASRGFVSGLIVIAAVTLLLGATGSLELERGEPGPEGFAALGSVLFVALAWLVQGSTDEVLFRGWLLQTIAARHGTVLGVGISSVVFVLAHQFEPNLNPVAILNLFLGGIFFALYALHEGSLWGVCALHATMNWAEVNVFGFDQFGGEASGGVLLNLGETGPDLITGGDNAAVLAGGLAYTVVMVTGIAVILLLARRRSHRRNSSSEN